MADPTERHTFHGGPLSNFAACTLELVDPSGTTRTYASVEHFFQASKAARLEDHLRIANARSPKEAKRLGRRVALREDWEAVKEAVMLIALRQKFQQRRFADVLLATGQTVIVEDSPHDFEWGGRDPRGGWEGENKLGLLLMDVRRELQEGALPIAERNGAQMRLELDSE